MAVYSYKALTHGGKQVTGVTDAETPAEARRKLRGEKLLVTEITPVERQRRSVMPRLFSLGRAREVGLLTRQLATLLESGIPLADALAALVDQVENKALEAVLRDVRESVTAGGALGDALGRHPTYFDEVYTSMVAAGEASGTLDQVLERLSAYRLRQDRLRTKVMAILTYPMILVTISVIVVSVLLIWVIPNIAEVFEAEGAELPLPTKLVMALSDAVKGWRMIVWFAGAGSLFAAYKALEAGPAKVFFDRLRLRLPIFGSIIRKREIARFSSTFGTLLRSGIPAIECLGILQRIMSNAVLSNTIGVIRNRIAEGQDIATPIRSSGVFPPVVGYMIAIGEESGRLEDILDRLSEAYEEEIELSAQRLTTLLEPVMIIVMAVVVGFIVLSILLPILEMTGSLEGGG